NTITFNVTSVLDSPVITSNGGGDNALVDVTENTLAVTTVTASDGDAGDTLSFSLDGGADADKFTIDTSTGVLSFKNAPDFETPTDVGGNGVYDVNVKATDTNGLFDIQSIAVTVKSSNEAPALPAIGGKIATAMEAGSTQKLL